MELLSHRGYWKSPIEKNTKKANEASFKNGWGIETDIRDYNGNLVISHDIAMNSDYPLRYLFEQYKKSKNETTLAINIKADGLCNMLLELLEKYKITNYFTFDMSVPETLKYLDAGLNVFLRYSEFEIPNAVLYERCNGIWLDIFKNVWYDNEFVNVHLASNKKIAFVSPELHNRNEPKLWEMVRENKWNKSSQTMLCTDLPDAATNYFEL